MYYNGHGCRCVYVTALMNVLLFFLRAQGTICTSKLKFMFMVVLS